jgi:HlyD family secretion protein
MASTRAASHGPNRAVLIVGVLALVALAIAGVSYFVQRGAAVPANEVRLSGRLESDRTDVASKASGRVAEVTVREGARVRRGQVLARLEDDARAAAVAAASAQLAVAERNASSAHGQPGVLGQQLHESELGQGQATLDAAGRGAQAEAGLATARAQLELAKAQAVQARADLELAERDRTRAESLVRSGDISVQSADQARTRAVSARAVVSARDAAIVAAQRGVESAQAGVELARTSAFNPRIRAAQSSAVQQQIEQSRTNARAADAQVEAARAQRAQALSAQADLIVRSPIDGVVTVRAVEPGAVVAPGRILLSLIDPNAVYMRGFIPEGDIGRIRVGQSAKIFLDSAAKEPLAGHVAAIDAEASFTPENVYFKNDRVRQVFGVRIDIENPAGFAKPGMPADGTILLDR